MDKLKSTTGLVTVLRARNAPLSDKLCQTDSLLGSQLKGENMGIAEKVEEIIDIWIHFHELGNYDKVPKIKEYDHLAKTIEKYILDNYDLKEKMVVKSGSTQTNMEGK